METHKADGRDIKQIKRTRVYTHTNTHTHTHILYETVVETKGKYFGRLRLIMEIEIEINSFYIGLQYGSVKEAVFSFQIEFPFGQFFWGGPNGRLGVDWLPTVFMFS